MFNGRAKRGNETENRGQRERGEKRRGARERGEKRRRGEERGCVYMVEWRQGVEERWGEWDGRSINIYYATLR